MAEVCKREQRKVPDRVVPRERAKFFPIDERKYCQTKDINVAQTPTPIINPIFFGFRQWSICRAREIGKYRSSLFVATE